MTGAMMPSRPGGPARVTAATAAGIAIGILMAAPATGAENKSDLLQLSRDGVHFATTSPPTLFRSNNGYVPGESRHETVWVRNGSAGTMRLSLGVRHTGASVEDILPGYLRLQATAQGQRAETAILPSPGGCAPVIHDWSLAAGEVLPLTLDLSLQVEAPNPTRNQHADFDLVFVLQESGAGPMVGPCSRTAGSSLVAGAVVSVGIAGAVAGRAPGTGAADDGDLNNEAQFVAGRNPQQSRLHELQDKPWPLPLMHQLQSNVEAIVRTPWPWLALLGAGLYEVTLTRRRRRTR